MLTEKFQFSVAQNGKGIVFNETTGIYLASFNEGGWGAPNPETTDATSSVLDIYLPDPTTYYWADNLNAPVTQNIYPAYPTTYLEQTLDIPSTNLGVGDAIISDGIIKITLTTVAGGNTYTTDAYLFNTFNLQVQKCRLAAVIAKNCCNFNDPKTSLYLDLVKCQELICDLMEMEEYETAAELYQNIAIKLNKINDLI